MSESEWWKARDRGCREGDGDEGEGWEDDGVMVMMRLMMRMMREGSGG